MTDENPSNQDALSKRLRGLRRTPVSLADFDSRMRERLPPMTTESNSWTSMLRQLFTPAKATAAGLLMLIIVVTSVVVLTGQPVRASAQELAEVYRSSVVEHGGSTPIATIDDARLALRQKFPRAPQLPDEPAGMKPMSCCVHEIGRRQMACVTFIVDEQPVTLALAPSTDVRSAVGTELVFQNTKFVTGSSDGINMVMTERSGTWMCLMGSLPHDRLAQLSVSLQN